MPTKYEPFGEERKDVQVIRRWVIIGGYTVVLLSVGLIGIDYFLMGYINVDSLYNGIVSLIIIIHLFIGFKYFRSRAQPTKEGFSLYYDASNAIVGLIFSGIGLFMLSLNLRFILSGDAGVREILALSPFIAIGLIAYGMAVFFLKKGLRERRIHFLLYGKYVCLGERLHGRLILHFAPETIDQINITLQCKDTYLYPTKPDGTRTEILWKSTRKILKRELPDHGKPFQIEIAFPIPSDLPSTGTPKIYIRLPFSLKSGVNDSFIQWFLNVEIVDDRQRKTEASFEILVVAPEAQLELDRLYRTASMSIL